MKTATIVGARPQFIKAAAVYRALRAYEGIKDVLIHTGQYFHSDISDIFLNDDYRHFRIDRRLVRKMILVTEK